MHRAVLVALTVVATGMGVVWIVSHSRGRAKLVWRYAPTRGREINIYLNEGSFLVLYVRDVAWSEIWSRGVVIGTLECRLGAGDRRHHRPGYARFVRIGSPFWIPFGLLGIYPVLAFTRGPLRRYCRRRGNRCVGCGYSLTGNVSGVCPECGKPV